MTRWLPLLICLCGALLIHGQAPSPVPTLAVPTLAPARPTDSPSLLNQSALADIRESQVLRVGALYNEPPYSALTLQGGLAGLDIELLRAIAELWGVALDFQQVTRLNAADALESGAAHVVAAALPHYQDADPRVDFTQSYYSGSQSLLVREDSQLQSLDDMAGAIIGFALGSRGEKALDLWRARSGIDFQAEPHLTLDRAVTALALGRIDAVAGEGHALIRLKSDYELALHLLDTPLLEEPRAYAIRRGDAQLRSLLNRSIQFLAESEAIDLLRREYFSGESPDEGDIIIWHAVGEEVSPAQIPIEIRYPAQPTIERLRTTGQLRATGLDAGDARLSALNHAVAAELAARWGVALEEIPGSADAGLQGLRAGTVELVAGVKLDWRLADGIDFSAPYLLQGDRLMIPARSTVSGFYDLRNRVVAVMLGDDAAWQRALAWAESIKVTIRRFDTTIRGAAQTLLDFNNANAVYANSLQLVSHLDANPNMLKLTGRWYSRDYYAFALPYNDADFRRLVNYTLQEMMQDGTLTRLSGSLLLGADLPAFPIVPGGSQFAGFDLGAR